MQLPRPIAGGARGDAIAILASLMPSSRSSLSLPTPLIDAAYEAVRFDEDWAINSRRAPASREGNGLRADEDVTLG
ncbi:MAG: hypothetical protein WA709_10465, partial [Stellaceae bacterium]